MLQEVWLKLNSVLRPRHNARLVYYQRASCEKRASLPAARPSFKKVRGRFLCLPVLLLERLFPQAHRHGSFA